MTPEDSIYRVRLRTLALAEELGNVRAACRVMGIHHSTFYRWKRQADTGWSCCDRASGVGH